MAAYLVFLCIHVNQTFSPHYVLKNITEKNVAQAVHVNKIIAHLVVHKLAQWIIIGVSKIHFINFSIRSISRLQETESE